MFQCAVDVIMESLRGGLLEKNLSDILVIYLTGYPCFSSIWEKRIEEKRKKEKEKEKEWSDAYLQSQG